MFFGEKYTYCKDSSCLILNEVTLYEGAEKVLSEGEKSIIAFCHYIASTHDCINIESDYKKIFFIIDDPISSMDYTYTYTLSQVLRNINLELPNVPELADISKFSIKRDEKILEEIIKPSYAMLKDKGKLYIIHRTDRMIELINLLTKYKFGIKRLQIIYPNEHSNGSMIIIEAKKNCKHDVKILSPIFTNI